MIDPSIMCEPMSLPAGCPPVPRVVRLGDLLDAWEADAKAAYDARMNGHPRGPVSGLPTLTREFAGAFWPGLHFMHGTPGAGKTALALQIAASCGCPCLFISCEMGLLELLRRITARVTDTYLGRLKSGELEPEDSLVLVKRAVIQAPMLTLVDATQAFASQDWIIDQARQCQGDAQHLLIIVDSLHSWAESNPTATTEYETLNCAIRALKVIAATMGCPVLAVTERNRASMVEGGPNAGAGTRKIEYGAETVLELNREKGAVVDVNGEVPVTLRISKNRNGAPGRTITVLFHGALQRFREVKGGGNGI